MASGWTRSTARDRRRREPSTRPPSFAAKTASVSFSQRDRRGGRPARRCSRRSWCRSDAISRSFASSVRRALTTRSTMNPARCRSANHTMPHPRASIDALERCRSYRMGREQPPRMLFPHATGLLLRAAEAVVVEDRTAPGGRAGVAATHGRRRDPCDAQRASRLSHFAPSTAAHMDDGRQYTGTPRPAPRSLAR